jgi:hypothetical protein
MNLREKLTIRFDKEEKERLGKIIASDPKLFAELWSLIKTADSPIPEYGSWVLDHCVAINPTLVQPHLDEMIAHFPLPNHNSIHRNLGKILAQVEIPEQYQGELYSLCIDRLLMPQMEVAVKVHCMEIAYNIARDIPELKEELALVINDQMEFNSAGFKSRGKKILKRLGKR